MTTTSRISSLQNPRVKYVAKLRTNVRQRRHDKLMLVEGWDEIQLALAADPRPHLVIRTSDTNQRTLDGHNTEVLEVSREVFKKLSFRENPDGWLAVFHTPSARIEDLKLSPNSMLMVAESVEKPGNLGAILRTVDAAGLNGLVVCDPRVDLYSPNVVRASRGAIFTVPTAVASSQQAIKYLRSHAIRIVAATPAGEDVYTKQDMTGPVAIAVGTEDQGLSDTWLSIADARVRIPVKGRINSLNVSVAAALIVYEALRQRGD